MTGASIWYRENGKFYCKLDFLCSSNEFRKNRSVPTSSSPTATVQWSSTDLFDPKINVTRFIESRPTVISDIADTMGYAVVRLLWHVQTSIESNPGRRAQLSTRFGFFHQFARTQSLFTGRYARTTRLTQLERCASYHEYDQRCKNSARSSLVCVCVRIHVHESGAYITSSIEWLSHPIRSNSHYFSRSEPTKKCHQRSSVPVSSSRRMSTLGIGHVLPLPFWPAGRLQFYFALLTTTIKLISSGMPAWTRPLLVWT